MRTVLSATAWTFVAAVVVYLAAGPGIGVAFKGPFGALGVGLIGLGLCLNASRRSHQTKPSR